MAGARMKERHLQSGVSSFEELLLHNFAKLGAFLFSTGPSILNKDQGSLGSSE